MFAEHEDADAGNEADGDVGGKGHRRKMENQPVGEQDSAFEETEQGKQGDERSVALRTQGSGKEQDADKGEGAGGHAEPIVAHGVVGQSSGVAKVLQPANRDGPGQEYAENRDRPAEAGAPEKHPKKYESPVLVHVVEKPSHKSDVFMV